jgi:signal transduction histidine kinase
VGGLKNSIDSLYKELTISISSERKIDLALDIAGKYLATDPDSIIKYAERALELSLSEDNLRGQIGALGFLGEAQIYKGNLPKTLELGLQAMELSKNLPIEKTFIGPTYYNMAELYAQIGDYEKSFIYSQKEIDVEVNGKTGGAYGYYQRANAFIRMNMPDSALKNLEMSYKLFESRKETLFGSQYNVYPSWYNLRAKVYYQQGKLEECLQDLITGLELTKNSNEPFHITNFCNDISLYYQNTNQLDSSIFYAEKGLSAANQISYIQGIYAASKLLAEQYEVRDTEKALFYYKLATQTKNQLYGAGNIQIMRDMIAQNEEKQRALEAAEIESRNRIRLNTLLGSLFTLFVVAILLYRNNRMKQKAKLNIENAYEKLKSTQSQLIQSEKMASLGELTAGIAHEIQNPLNFVNNFSEVSGELVDELQDELNMNNPDVAREISNDIKQNLDKIHHHGMRASEIVRSMLQHSRTGTGEKEPTDINALADEYLRLAYHGLRAKDKSFNAEFKTDFDESLPKINVVPQDIGRVLLNLINNAFQAVNEKAARHSELDEESGTAASLESYTPEVFVSTTKLDNKIEIRVKDNGPGIPKEIKDKVFQPFFTTKPTGQGTGLGLSLSYDIVKAHGGEIRVETKQKVGTQFIISLEIK